MKSKDANFQVTMIFVIDLRINLLGKLLVTYYRFVFSVDSLRIRSSNLDVRLLRRLLSWPDLLGFELPLIRWQVAIGNGCRS